MCLAVPMKIEDISGNMAVATFSGVQREVCLDVIDTFPSIGNYVLVHAGFAIHLIDDEIAEETIGYLKTIISEEEIIE